MDASLLFSSFVKLYNVSDVQFLRDSFQNERMKGHSSFFANIPGYRAGPS